MFRVTWWPYLAGDPLPSTLAGLVVPAPQPGEGLAQSSSPPLSELLKLLEWLDSLDNSPEVTSPGTEGPKGLP